ncbi:MAG: protein kinase [Clostridia bacterium]|nr:protein kinase [Clostridia bacterium]
MKCQNCGVEIQKAVKFCPKCGSKLEQPPVEKAPVKGNIAHDISRIWPEWQIEKQLGRGSYGVVYQAIRRDNNVESHAAIKIISIPYDSSEIDSMRSEGLDMNGTKTYFKGIVDDFVSEIRLMESLKGIQNIVSVEDYKVVEKTSGIGWDIYIRMELLTPFNTYICDKALTEAEIIKLGTDICTALEICGQRNIIHRDIKPENIFVNDFGHFKLGDFGIARKLENMTGGLSQKGTFNYMAPEVANGNGYDARVDTYSLGIVLYRLLNNNKLPFLDTEKQLLNPGERKLAVERRLHGEALPSPCNASPSMANLILRACAYDPKVRFSSATEMKQALMNVANGTYTIVNSDPDRTTAVRSADANYNATTAVRKATKSSDQKPQPVVNTPVNTPKQKKSKGKKAKIIAVSVLFCIVALAVALAVMFFKSTAYGVYSNMKTSDFEDALDEYHSEVEDSFVQKILLDMLLKDRVNEIATEYENGKLNYEEAVGELNALNEMDFDGAKEKIDELTAANDSENALAKADEYYENGDYENAISEYSKVPESNKNYEEAQNKLTQVYADYISSTVATAKKHNSSKNYKQAVQVVNTAYDILPDSVDTTDLDTVKEESLASYKTEVANEVAELTENEKWSEAFDLIDEAIAFDDNEYFQNLKVSTEDKYVKSVSATVQKHLDNEDYISAKRVAENALTILPSNAALKELKKDVEDNTPVYLLDVCKPYSSNGYQAFVDGETISMGGKKYTNAFSLGEHGYANFNMDSEYESITFWLGHCDGTGVRGALIKIYFDGILQKEFNLSSDSLPQKITMDITGVQQFKVEWSLESNVVWGCAYGFGNVTVE